MKTIKQAIDAGYTIDYGAMGRPYAYKGERQGLDGQPTLTEQEAVLIEHVEILVAIVIMFGSNSWHTEKAISAINYVQMLRDARYLP